MKEVYEPLFTPWKIGNLEIKNRIVLAPMGGTSLFGYMGPSRFNKEAAGLILQIAQNNCGLIIPGVAPVRDYIGRAWLYQRKEKFDDLKEFMEKIHATGAKLFVQLTAGCGRSMALSSALSLLASNKALHVLAKPIIDPEYMTAAPSVLPNRWSDDVTCRALTKKEIQEMVYAFAETARLLKEAGVDGVEIHAVHEGYLLDQFTLKYTNHRTDEYGGSFENRYRFPKEIVEAIKEKCGKDYPVALRYSVLSKTKGFREGAMPGEEYIEAGRDMEESEKAAKYLQDAGYDMLDCDNGTYDAWYWPHPPVYMPLNCNLAEVTHIKKFVDIPVVCAGRMVPADGAKAIAAGDIDAMGVGRQFLADPEWLTKLMGDSEDEIKPCICCHNACLNWSRHEGTANDQDLLDTLNMCRCAVTPTTMQSKKYKIVPADQPKNIAVIGGGIGGMEAARVAALRGHKVTLYEKSDVLGGVFIAAAAPEYKEHDKQLIEWFKRQVAKNPNITVKMNTEVTDVKALGADEVVVATGAVANRLSLPGAERTISAVDYLLGNEQVGDDVIVIGGGLTGCEIAMDLYNKGKRPVLVEIMNDLMAVPNLSLANASFLRDFMKSNNVPVYLETKCLEIGPDYVLLQDKNMKQYKLPADSVITSVGYKPAPVAPATQKEITLAIPNVGTVATIPDPRSRGTKGNPPVYLVGDCNKVGNLRHVIWRAWDIAMKL